MHLQSPFTTLGPLSQLHDDFPFLTAKMTMYVCVCVLKYKIIEYDARGEHFKVSSTLYIQGGAFIEEVLCFSPILFSLISEPKMTSVNWTRDCLFLHCRLRPVSSNVCQCKTQNFSHPII